MRSKILFILLVLVAVAGVGSYAVKAYSGTGVTTVIEHADNVTVTAPETPASLVSGSLEPQLGAAAGPDLPFTYFSFGGVRQFAGSMDMYTASTTVCAIQSPAVTSTLSYGSLTFDVSSSTASVVTMAKSNTAFVTTTLLQQDLALAANAQGVLFASTTDALPPANAIFNPGQWFVVSMKGGSGTFSPTGHCQAVWTSLK